MVPQIHMTQSFRLFVTRVTIWPNQDVDHLDVGHGLTYYMLDKKQFFFCDICSPFILR